MKLQPAAATAAEAATEVTRRDGSFALATPGQGTAIVSLMGASEGGAPWALHPPQQEIQVDGAGRVSPRRLTFKLVAAQLQGQGKPLSLLCFVVVVAAAACPQQTVSLLQQHQQFSSCCCLSLRCLLAAVAGVSCLLQALLGLA